MEVGLPASACASNPKDLILEIKRLTEELDKCEVREGPYCSLLTPIPPPPQQVLRVLRHAAVCESCENILHWTLSSH